MKKDKEWLKEEVEDLQIYSNPEVRADRSDPYTQYVGGVNDAVSRVKELLDQLDEPEKVVIPQFVAEAFEKAKGSNVYAEQLISAMYESSDEVGYWLEVPSNEKLLLRAWMGGYEPEKVVIPQFVADWWERDDDSVTMYGRLRVEKKHKFDLISIFYDKGLGDHLSKVEDWLDENDSVFLDLVNGKPYETEKEKLYIVQLPTNLEDDLIILDADGDIRKDSWPSRYKMTEKRIKEIDERYWPFAVEVSE